MRITYIISTLNIGGAQIGMCRLLNKLDENKYDVLVVSLDGRIKETKVQIPSNVEVINIYKPDNLIYPQILTLIREVRKSDVIVGSLYHASLISKILGTINSNSTVCTWRHNTEFKNKKRMLAFKHTNKLTDIIIADSLSVAERLQNDYNIGKDNIHVVPIAGINLDDYKPVIHEKRNVSVGTVGTLTKQKNHETILDVASQLQSSDISFEIAGCGDLDTELQKRIVNEELTNVTLHGFVDDVPSFLSEIDIYFQPSLYEGLCITVLEAMASGLPIVGSEVGGIKRNVDHGQNGFLRDPRAVNQFTADIIKLSENPNLRSEYGKVGRKKVQRKFTDDVLLEEFESVINGVN